MSCSDANMKELLSLYVDDACSLQEKQAVETHVAQCADCRQELADLQWIVASLREMPDIPLPIGFTEAWQARLREEIALEGEAAANSSAEEAVVAAPLQKPQKKHWFCSCRFVGIAATVLLCFSISVIGGHINTGYDHLVRNSLHQEMIAGEQSYEKTAAAQKTTAVADNDKYSGGIFSGLNTSNAMRNEEGVSSSSRDGSVIEHYILEDFKGINGDGLPEDGASEIDSGNASGMAFQSEPTVSGERNTETVSAEEPTDTSKARGVQNSQLQTKAAQQMAVAQNASNREVYNGYMALTTEDIGGAKDQVISVAARYEGCVDEAAVLSEEDNQNIRMEIRVKSEHLEAAMEDIAKYGQVTARSINRVDLSESYYDAQGRLTRQRALEQSLLRLIAEAEDIETIHALEQELEMVTTEIETIIANLEKISQQRKYSTIVVNIASDPLAGAEHITAGDKFRLGLQSFIGFCKSFPDNLLVGFGFMFEIFAVVIILSILFYLVMHKLLRKPATAVSRKNEPEK